MDRKLIELLESSSSTPPREFVDDALARCEAVTRRIALVALSHWARLGVRPDAKLYEAVTDGCKASWGGWSRIIDDLAKRTKAEQTSGTSAVRNALNAEHPLVRIAALWGTVLDARAGQCLESLGELEYAPQRTFASKQSYPRSTVAHVMQRLVELRNRIVHDRPSGHEYWRGLTDALTPILDIVATQPRPACLDSSPELASPWLILKDSDVLEFNGLDSRLAAHYVDSNGHFTSMDQSTAVTHAIEELLDLDGLKAKRLGDLLKEIVSASDRGVLLKDDFFLQEPLERQGQQATIFRARQLSTGRRCAVKVLRRNADGEAVARMTRESEYLGMVENEHVVAVLSSGPAHWHVSTELAPLDGWHLEHFGKERFGSVPFFIALEWIDGSTLEEVITSEPPLDPNRALSWFEQAADGLDAIHKHKIIHRDIKPANVMVTRNDVIKIMDLGLGHRRAAGEEPLTAVGTIVGTYAYMSPEQVRAAESDAAVDARSDIYSLCATFYELFTRHRFLAHDQLLDERVRQLRREGPQPPPPSEVARDVTEQSRKIHTSLLAQLREADKARFRTPDQIQRAIEGALSKEIDDLLLGGLEPDPESRYESARALLEDIGRCRRSEPLRHEPPSPWRRVVLTYRRHRRTSNVAAALILVLLAATVGYVIQINAERSRTRVNYAALLVEQARLDSLADRPTEAIGYLMQAMQQGRDDPALRLLLGTATPALDALHVRLGNVDRPLSQSTFSPDGSHLAAIGGNGGVEVYQVHDGKLVARQEDAPICDQFDLRSALTWSPDGVRLVRKCDEKVFILEPTTLSTLCELSGHAARILSLAVSLEGEALVTGGDDGRAVLWSLTSCRQMQIFPHGNVGVSAVAIYGNEPVILSGDTQGRVRAWDGRSGRFVAEYVDERQAIVDSVFLSKPDSDIVAIGSRLSRWDLMSRSLLRSEPLSEVLHGGVFTEKGNRLLAHSDANRAATLLLDLSTGETVRALPGLGVGNATFSSDAQNLVAAGNDGRLDIYEASSGKRIAALRRPSWEGRVSAIEVDPRKKYVAVNDAGGVVDLLRWPRAPSPLLPDGLRSESYIVVPRVRGEGVLVLDVNGGIHECRGGSCRGVELGSDRSQVVTAATELSGRYLAVLDIDGVVAIWDVEAGRRKWRTLLETMSFGRLKQEERHLARYLRRAKFSQSGRVLVVSDERRRILVFDVESGRLIRELALPETASSRLDLLDVFCKDSFSGCLALWSREEHGPFFDGYSTNVRTSAEVVGLESGEVVARLTGYPLPDVFEATFSSDGAEVVTADRGGFARLYDSLTGAVLATYREPDKEILEATLSWDKSLLATGSADGAVTVWSTRPAAPLWKGAAGVAIREMMFSPGDRFIVASDYLRESGVGVVMVPRESRSKRELEALVEEKARFLCRESESCS